MADLHPQVLDIHNRIRARYPLIYVVSGEEKRVEEHLLKLEQASAKSRRIVVWSATEGFVSLTDDFKNDAVDSPHECLEFVLNEDPALPSVYILRDFHPYWGTDDGGGDPMVRRLVRDLARALRRQYKNVVFLSPVMSIPSELEREMCVVRFALPTRDEITAQLDNALQLAKKLNLSPTKHQKEAIVEAALGLESTSVNCVIARSLVEKHDLDVQMIVNEKEDIIKRSGILEFVKPDLSFDDVGGLDRLKDWLRQRRFSFGQSARDFGVDAPKGVLLVGIPGCGKSLTAKVVADFYKMPLLKLDVGKLFGSLVGQSEENTRKAISLAETVAPSVLMLDEVDKGLGGAGGGGNLDGGTTSRVFGTILTWLQEKKSPVFVIATANNVNVLPPEFLRKGRFDELFALDLPNQEERVEILKVHLRRRKRTPSLFDLPLLGKHAKGLTGAEIEQGVKSALTIAWTERCETGNDAIDINTDRVQAALEGTIGIASTMPERIEALRTWCQTRGTPASSKEVDTDFSDQAAGLELEI